VGINPAIKGGQVDGQAAMDATAEATDRKLAWVKEAAGDRFDDLELNVLSLATLVTDDQHGTAEMMAGLFGLDTDGVLEVPHALIGSVEQMIEQLQARRERWGFSYVVVQGDALESFAPVVAALAGT